MPDLKHSNIQSVRADVDDTHDSRRDAGATNVWRTVLLVQEMGRKAFPSQGKSGTIGNNPQEFERRSFQHRADATTRCIPLSQAINKYFELSIYLLVLMGFGTLASTDG